MPAKIQKKRRTRVTLTRTSEALDVRMAAELLTVSPDTVYDLFKRGELPGRKVGRKWLSATCAVRN
jgi:excisionase family DNA binding protein